MFNFVRSLAAPVLGAIDKLNSFVEPFKEPLPVSLPDLDSVVFKLESIRKVCHDDLPKFKKTGGFFWDVVPNDLGDNCLWQGVYLAYLANIGDMGGVNNVLMENMIPLSNYGGPGVLLRGIAAWEEVTDDLPKRFLKLENGRQWMCVDDASLGSLLGFCYGLTYALRSPRTYRFVDKVLIQKLAASVADTVIANDYHLINHDGSKSTWGDLSPKLTQAPIRLLGLLALLKLAGMDEMYTKIYKECRPVLAYAETHFSYPGGTWHPWFQDHLAFMAYDILMTLDIRAEYITGLKRMWAKDRKWANPYFAAVVEKHLQFTLHPEDMDVAMDGLLSYDYPLCKCGSKTNSTRTDITVIKYDGKLVSDRALRVGDRPPTNYLWQRNPYQLDGKAIAEYSGLDFLTAYTLFVNYSSRFKQL